MTNPIDSIDLTKSMSHDESEVRITAAQHRLVQLRLFTAGLIEPHQQGPGLVVLFEGFDAAGKGGAIQRLAGALDPRHVRVVPVGPPTEEETRHHFLWRFQQNVPGQGEMTVFDRSWYGRLLVEHVEGEVTGEDVARSAKEIVEFEDMLIQSGVTIVKFWLHVSSDEQLRRFNDRASHPLKQWKLTADDWRNREKREAYLEALRFMVNTTDHPHAHWDLISGEDKHFARVNVLETLAERWAHDLTRRGYRVPAPVEGNYLH